VPTLTEGALQAVDCRGQRIQAFLIYRLLRGFCRRALHIDQGIAPEDGHAGCHRIGGGAAIPMASIVVN
jgi:hypothetical protein